jgi:hypothetical protein
MFASETHPAGLGRHIGFATAALVVFALGAWVLAYASGAFPWLGYAWLTRSSIGLGPVTVGGESRYGTSFGLKTFLLFAGQEAVVEYDADIRAGSLWLYVYEPYDGRLGDGVSRYVTSSGSGTWTVPIRKTAFYTIVVEPSPTKGAGRGWDLSYTARWGARPAGRGA